MSRAGHLLSPLLIGRDDLLDLAERRIEEVAAGRGNFLLLAGEAGIGKSRLMSAIVAKARVAQFQTASGFVAPQDRDVPAALLFDMARSMIRLPTWEVLGRSLLALSDATLATPQPRRRLLVLQAVDLLVGALDEPTIMLFDDLQWADNLSLEVLTELGRATRDRPLLILGAYRTDELAPGAHLREWRSRLLTQRMAEEARLARLTLDETALMTTLILDTGLPAPREVVAAVYERTDGVPLHVEELLAAIAEDDRTNSRAIRDARVPETLEDAILQRIGRLSPEAQVVARSGAAIGRCFVPEVLAGIMDVPVEALDDPLRELIDQQVLEPPGLRGLYDYRHQLLRDALYRSLPDGERRRLHARAGEFGKELEGASEVHASVHYERAGMTTQAFRSALQGAEHAARLSSHREAFELYQRAVHHMPRDHADTEQAEILAAFATEAAAIEEIEVCDWAAAEARERFDRAGESARAMGQLAHSTGMARRRAGPLPERIAAIQAGLNEVADLPAGPHASRIRGQLCIELGYAAIDGADLVGARDAILAARNAAAAAGDDELMLSAASLEGVVDAIHGKLPASLDRLAAVALDARERGFEDASVTAYRDAAVAAARVMDYGRAKTAIDEGLRYADAIEQSHCAHIMAATGALVAWAEGNWDEAVARGEHAVADRGCDLGVLMARWPLGYTALGRGETEIGLEHLQAAETAGRACGAPHFVLAATWGLAELSQLAGDHADTIARSDEALELARHTGELGGFVPFVVTGTRARLAAGRPADAERWLAAASQQLGAVDWFTPAIDHAGGLLSLSAGSTGQARASLERAVDEWDAHGRTWESLWARLDLAGCLMRTGRFVDAANSISAVRAAAEELRSRPLLKRVEDLARLNRGRETEAPAWHPLTAREFEVARLIANGLTNAAIAAELAVAPKTVSAHVEHILGKLGAARRTEIASWVATTAPPQPSGRRRPEQRSAAVDRSGAPIT